MRQSSPPGRPIRDPELKDAALAQDFELSGILAEAHIRDTTRNVLEQLSADVRFQAARAGPARP